MTKYISFKNKICFFAKDKVTIFGVVFLVSIFVFAGCVGLSTHPIPSEDVLKKGVVDVGRSMGLEEAYQDISEGIFIWRVRHPIPNQAQSSNTCTGLFTWYIKRLSNGVAMDDPLIWPCGTYTSNHISEITAESERLQKEFIRRWLATVGSVEFIPPTDKTHSSDLLGTVLGLISREHEVRTIQKSLPPSPDGFTWRKLLEINADILIPSGWHFKRVVDSKSVEAVSYFLSRENMDINGSFEEGLSIQLLTPRPKTTSDEVNVTITNIVDNVCKSEQIVKPIWESSQSNYKHYGCTVRENGKNGTFLLHLRLIINIKTNTTYQLTFESPENQWEESWKKGSKMIDQFLIDEKI